MTIPKSIKRQAREAVFHRETSAYIRSFGFCEVTDFFEPQARPAEVDQPRPTTEDVKRQAVAAVSRLKTTSSIEMVDTTGPVHAPATPSRDTFRAAAAVSTSGAALGVTEPNTNARSDGVMSRQMLSPSRRR